MTEIIPAIDLIDGQVVRLSQGRFDQARVYSSRPLEVARRFADAGVRRLHVVDLDGARDGRPQNLGVVENMCRETAMVVDVGGGIRDASILQDVFNAGAAMVSVGSQALINPDEVESWIERYGAEKFFLGADVRGENLVYRGWQASSSVGWREFIGRWMGRGVNYFFSTNVERDGDLQGADHDLYKAMMKQFAGIRLVASGGVSSIRDAELAREGGLDGVIIGRAWYEGLITMDEIKQFMQYAG